MNVRYVQTITKQLLNILRNYFDELTKATGGNTCFIFIISRPSGIFSKRSVCHIASYFGFAFNNKLMLLSLRNNTNNAASFFTRFFPLTKATVKWLAFLLVIQKIGNSNLGPNTVSPQIVVVYLNPS
jgi:hypothetical protein